jgi:hypothetical protein
MFILCRESLIAIVIVIEIVIAIVIERLYRKLVASRERVFDDYVLRLIQILKAMINRMQMLEFEIDQMLSELESRFCNV